jgi:hypothetical protein
MKEWATSIIGVAFALALIVYFGMGKIPLDVFGPITTAAILWFFREQQIAKMIKKIKEGSQSETKRPT